MTLEDIRNLFVELTGRADLLQAGMAAGADFYINEGSKELDRRLFGGKSEASYAVDLDQGQILVPVPNCRAIKKVYIYSADEKTELSKCDNIDEMREYYSEPKSGITQDTPFVYHPINARPYPSVISISGFNQAWAFEDILEDSHESFNSILICPPPDTATYTLKVEGLFYSDELVNSGDFNYWSINHPLTLVQAAMFKLEQTYRNTEGAKDHDAAIAEVMFSLNADLVEEEIEDFDQMDG